MHTFEILNQCITSAKQQVEVGALYYHYRTPTQHYRVLAIALDEATEQPCVVYQAMYGEKLIWVRTLDAWCDQVECQGEIFSRFIKIIES